MSEIETKFFNKIFKQRYPDFGIRITNLVQLPFEQSIGSIYQGLYYDSSDYSIIKPRYIFISQEKLDKNWVEVE